MGTENVTGNKDEIRPSGQAHSSTPSLAHEVLVDGRDEKSLRAVTGKSKRWRARTRKLRNDSKLKNTKLI